MAKGYRTCRICGKRYEYCRTSYKDTNMFRWQDIACCPEHGAEFFALVAASRTEPAAPVEETRQDEIAPVFDEEPAESTDAPISSEDDGTAADPEEISEEDHKELTDEAEDN